MADYLVIVESPAKATTKKRIEEVNIKLKLLWDMLEIYLNHN